jgi:hypothetical protein
MTFAHVQLLSSGVGLERAKCSMVMPSTPTMNSIRH